MVSQDRFPRSAELPTQSPLFWVQQKDRYLRQRLIRDIEEITGRRLLVFFCNRFASGCEIVFPDVARFYELVGDALGEDVDLLIETPGGETDATEAVISLLRQSLKSFRVLVPNAAKSNGTLIALHGSSIVMGPTSELGPIEPSMNGIPCSTLIREEVRQSNFALHVLAQHAMRQSQKLAMMALGTGMMKGSPPEQIERAIQALSTRDTYPSHGSVVDRQEASDLGLSVEALDAGHGVWDRIWLLYCMYDLDTRRDGIAKVFEGHTRSLAVSAVPA